MDDMTMSMSMSMATATASGAAPSSTGMDMDMDMDMGSGSGSSSSSMSMSSADMAMVFFQSVTTPLYASSWTPAGQGSYAGTCVFLIVLALSHRVLVALRFVLFDSNPALHRHGPHHNNHNHNNNDNKPHADHDPALLPPPDPEANTPGSMLRQIRFQWSHHPFRVATETSRALLEVVIGGIGYLL